MIIAYLDPATGGLVIQSLIAAAVAVPFILRTQIARGLARIRSRQVTPSNEDHPPENG